MPTLNDIKEHFQDLPKSNKFTINNNDLNIEIKALDIDVENNKLIIERYMVSKTILNYPKDLSITFGGVEVECVGLIDAKVLQVSTLGDEVGNFISMKLELLFADISISAK